MLNSRRNQLKFDIKRSMWSIVLFSKCVNLKLSDFRVQSHDSRECGSCTLKFS